MVSKKFRFFKKAGWEGWPFAELAATIIVVVIIIAFSGYILKGTAWASETNQEFQATLNNFNSLIDAINSLDEGSEKSRHPIYLNEDYNIFGFEKGVTKINGKCNWKTWGIFYDQESREVYKPTACGNEGCLCLCKKKGNDECSPDAIAEVNLPICKPMKLSFKGGKSKDEWCDFAYIAGSEGVRNIYLKRDKGKDIVRICADECA